MKKENKTLNLISLGCAKNLVDSEILLGGLDKTNISVTNDPEAADTIVVNTCGFLDIAREESVDTILQAAELKKTGSLKELVVMGCLSERYPEELKKEIPEVDRIFGSNDHKQIVSFLTGKDYAKDDPLFFRYLRQTGSIFLCNHDVTTHVSTILSTKVTKGGRLHYVLGCAFS